MRETYNIQPKLLNFYQNSAGIGSLIMEKTPYGIVGCRATAIYRMINFMLMKKGFIQDPIPFEKLDEIADEGGLYNDCWFDGTNKNPIFNVLKADELVKKINKKFGSDLKYRKIWNFTDEEKSKLLNYVKSNIPLCKKMPNPYTTKYPAHFININGYVIYKGKLFFRMKETYKDKKKPGYDGKIIKWDFPGYYEVIL